MSFNIGENIGPYRIVEQLGQGGMATVFKAYHAALDRYVALKVLHPAFNEDKSFASRFQREARVVAKLEHPNIVPVYDFSEHEGRPYLVMKFVEGDTLKARMTESPLSPQEISKVVEAVGSALTYAHNQGILHRDIKPSNVICASDGQIYLADFGLARIAQSGESTMSSDQIMGTPQYISPEQAMGKRDLDAGTDMYSFGVMLYEMVVGRVPFSADTPFAVIHDHIYTPLPPPHTVNPNVPESVERILLKTLSKERTDRYEDVSTMVRMFKEAWSNASAPAPATMASPAKQVAEEAKPQPKMDATVRAAKAEAAEAGAGSKKKRSPMTWIAVGLILILCLGGIILARSQRLFGRFLAAQRQDAPPNQQAPLPKPTQKKIEPLPPQNAFTVTSSKTTQDSLTAIMDGDLETIWNSGADPVQWIQIDLGKPSTVTSIKLIVSQFPEGETVHQIWAGSKTVDPKMLHELKGVTRDKQILEFTPAQPLHDIRIVRIVTIKSPSWVAWREIQIIIPKPNP